MAAKSSLKQALIAIDDARFALELAKRHAKENIHDIRKALRQLDDAESDIKRAMREIPEAKD